MARLSKHTTPNGVEIRLMAWKHVPGTSPMRSACACTELTSSKLNVVTNVFVIFTSNWKSPVRGSELPSSLKPSWHYWKCKITYSGDVRFWVQGYPVWVNVSLRRAHGKNCYKKLETFIQNQNMSAHNLLLFFKPFWLADRTMSSQICTPCGPSSKHTVPHGVDLARPVF